METTDEPTLQEMDTEGKNTDAAYAADAELQFESPPPASEGEEIEVEEADETMPVTQPDVSHPEEEAVADPQSVEPESLKPEPVEPMEPMEPESTEATDPEPASPQEKDLPELKAPELPKEAQGPAPKLRNFFRRHAEEGRGHNPVSTSKIGIVAPAVEIVEKVNEENGDADDEAQIGEEMEHPAEHPAEPAVDVPEQPEEQPEEPEEPEQPEHLAEELEQPPESELANTDKAEQSPDQSEAKLDNSLEDTGTLTEDAKVEGQETSRPFTEAEEACVEVPASGRASLRSSEPERRSKSAAPFLAEMPERELARRVWRASAVPRAGGKPRVQETLTHVPQVPQGRGAPHRRDENRRILRGKNGPRSVSPREVASRRTPSAGRGKQAEKEKEPRVWKARKFQPESSAKMPFTRPPPPPPIEMLPEMTWKPQKAPERVRVHRESLRAVFVGATGIHQ